MSFQKVELSLRHCAGCEVVGFLYDSDDFADLGQDMVEVRIPGNVTINAGWYPEGSPDGAYTIKTRGFEFPIHATTDVYEAAQMITVMVEVLTGTDPHPIHNASTTVTRNQQRDFQIA